MKKILLVAMLLPLFLHGQSWNAAQRFSANVGSTLTNATVATSPDGATYLAGVYTIAFRAENGFGIRRWVVQH